MCLPYGPYRASRPVPEPLVERHRLEQAEVTMRGYGILAIIGAIVVILVILRLLGLW